MMTIGSVTGTGNNMQAGNSAMNMQTDSISKSLQSQIANAQKALQELSSNEELSMEDKMKKRQEIQQQITDLNQQLRQHQIEQRREKQREGSSTDDLLGTNRKANTSKTGKGGSGFSQAGMRAMISADSSMKLADAQGSTITQMEGRAGVLESEIKMDKSRGASTQKKEEELADLQEKTLEATASQMNALADAGEALKEATAADSEAEKNADEKTDGASEVSDTDIKAAAKEKRDAEEHTAAELPVGYTSVDIRI